MYYADDDKGWGYANEAAKPVGGRKRQEHHDGNDEQDENDSQGGRRQQANHLVYHVQLDVFRLKSEIVLEQLDELPNVLNILVARQHVIPLRLRPGCRQLSRPPLYG